jgi:dipeptidyl aminopeptidase/acylaminoacyl peptidase
VLSKPADFDAHKKYPLFVFIHGGPEDVAIPYRLDPWNRYYPLLQLVAKGDVILQPNYRGSAGFGESFRRLTYRNLGTGSYQDILSGVNLLISQGFVDRNRVADMGWSQGGYISAFMACFSDRFRAVSAGGVTADWRTYYSTSDLPVAAADRTPCGSYVATLALSGVRLAGRRPSVQAEAVRAAEHVRIVRRIGEIRSEDPIR